MSRDAIQHFITRWSAASASERANSQLFLSELCDVLEVPRPQPTFSGGYAFEFPVPQQHCDGSVTEGRIDLYKRPPWEYALGKKLPITDPAYQNIVPT